MYIMMKLLQFCFYWITFHNIMLHFRLQYIRLLLLKKKCFCKFSNTEFFTKLWNKLCTSMKKLNKYPSPFAVLCTNCKTCNSLRWLWSGSEFQLLGAAESRAQCGGQREHHLAAAEIALPPVREPGLLQPGGAWNRARLQNRRRSILCRQSTVQDHGTRLILQVCL